MIKAIAFDLIRVLVKIKNVSFTTIEDKLSDEFNYKVGDELYWDWAQKVTGENLIKTKEICWRIINKIYEINEPDLFSKIPQLKFVVASNHLSMIKDWLKGKEVYDSFYSLVVSEDIKCQKPDLEFFEILIEKIGEKPEEILFVDDHTENIEGASKAGLQTLHYNGSRLLSEEISGYLKNER